MDPGANLNLGVGGTFQLCRDHPGTRTAPPPPKRAGDPGKRCGIGSGGGGRVGLGGSGVAPHAGTDPWRGWEGSNPPRRPRYKLQGASRAPRAREGGPGAAPAGRCVCGGGRSLLPPKLPVPGPSDPPHWRPRGRIAPSPPAARTRRAAPGARTSITGWARARQSPARRARPRQWQPEGCWGGPVRGRQSRAARAPRQWEAAGGGGERRAPALRGRGGGGRGGSVFPPLPPVFPPPPPPQPHLRERRCRKQPRGRHRCRHQCPRSPARAGGARARGAALTWGRHVGTRQRRQRTRMAASRDHERRALSGGGAKRGGVVWARGGA